MRPAVHRGAVAASPPDAVSRVGILAGSAAASGNRLRPGGAASLYRRLGPPRLAREMRYLGRCPSCEQTFTGAFESFVRTSVGGHHFYLHGRRLTDAELDIAVQELVTEKELAAKDEPKEPLQ